MAQRSASQWRATPRFKVSVGLDNQMIQLTSLRICLDLSIPSISGKFLEPRLELSKFLRSEVTDGELKFLDAHGKKLSPHPQVERHPRVRARRGPLAQVVERAQV